MKYCQCKLQKSTETGYITDVAWIPTKFAKKNKYLKIKNKGRWENGWKVISIGTILDEECIFDREYVQHRDITDK